MIVTLPEVVNVRVLLVITPGPEVTAKVTGRFEPPPVAERLTESVVSLSAMAAKAGSSAEAVFDQHRAANPSKRFGNPAEFGAFCAFLCSAHAGYMTGQNILLDGGAYPGTY